MLATPLFLSRKMLVIPPFFSRKMFVKPPFLSRQMLRICHFLVEKCWRHQLAEHSKKELTFDFLAEQFFNPVDMPQLLSI